MKSLNRVQISLKALAHNFNLCRQQAGGADVLAMVKADAYGHGMVECARVFADQGAKALGVAEVREGIALRRSGCTLPVYVFAGVIPQTLSAFFQHRLTPVAVDLAIAEALSREAVKRGREIELHLKMDAGMGRQGTLPASFAHFYTRVHKLPGVRIAGIMAHFPMSEDRSTNSSVELLKLFTQTLERLDPPLPPDCCRHLANSGGILYVPGAGLDMVRPGIALYGCYPDGIPGRAAAGDRELQPVMRFVSQVIQVREVPRGTGIGYGHTFVTQRPTTIAVLPVGYEDGYLRALSTKAAVLIRGQRVPVIGRISMNLTLVDITGMDTVMPGDEAVLLGGQGEGEITADEVAGWMNTISYEVLCLFGNLNRREFVA